jgi:hypothetical protein
MKPRLEIALLSLSLAAVVALSGARARAAEDEASHARVPLPGSDGVYGRFDGNLALAAAVGTEVEDGEPRGALRLSAHYLWTAGVYVRYSDAFGGANPRPARVVSFGVDLRPLFLPRFGRNYEQGPALLDLTLDSLSLSAGAYFAQPQRADFGDERGFEMGVGFGVPLFASPVGPWLEARAERRYADLGDNSWLFTLSLSVQAITWSTDSR